MFSPPQSALWFPGSHLSHVPNIHPNSRSPKVSTHYSINSSSNLPAAAVQTYQISSQKSPKSGTGEAPAKEGARWDDNGTGAGRPCGRAGARRLLSKGRPPAAPAQACQGPNCPHTGRPHHKSRDASHPAPMLETDKSRRTGRPGPRPSGPNPGRPALSNPQPRCLPRCHREKRAPGCLERPGSDECWGRGPAERRAPRLPVAASARSPQVSGAGPGDRAGVGRSSVLSGGQCCGGRTRGAGPSSPPAAPQGHGPSRQLRAFPAASAPSRAVAPSPDPGVRSVEATSHRGTSLPGEKPPQT